MKMQQKEKRLHTGLIIFALFMLFNPNINVIDLLPDFIGYWIIARVLAYAARRVPFLEEARQGFKRLALISFLHIPALLIMVRIRSLNTLDNDIIALLSLVFAVIEIIYAISAINNLFAGISYLGERTGAKSIIGENPTSDFLRILTIAFTVIKCVLYTLPELMLLTKTSDIGTLTNYTSASRYYPAVLLTAQIVGFTVGIVWIAFFIRYLRKIKLSGEYFPALMSLSSPEKEREIAYKNRLDSILSGLKLLPPAAFLTFEFTLEDIGNVNILPHFISAFIMIFALLRFRVRKDKINIATLSLGAAYVLFSVFAWLESIDFFDAYTYESIALNSTAEKEYLRLEIIFAIELILLIAFLICYAFSLCSFIRTHTGKTPEGVCDPLSVCEPSDDQNAYGIYDQRYHRSLKIRAFIFSSIGIAGGISRLVMMHFRGIRVFDHGAFLPETAPWFVVVVLAVCVIFGIFAMTFSSLLSEDFELKYASSLRILTERTHLATREQENQSIN